MFKIIASDMDGTLLTNDKKIMPQTIKVLNKASKKGCEFVICTGRMFASVKQFLPQLPFCNYAVCCNGAEIYDAKTLKRIHFSPMNSDDVFSIAQFAQDRDLHLHLYADDILYTNKIDELSQFYFKNTRTTGVLIKEPLEEFVQKKQFAKVLLLINPEDNLLLTQELEKIAGQNVNISSSSGFLIEATDKNVGKDTALKHIAKLLDVKMEEIIVFGDSGNDTPMLENTGFSCVVANAGEKQKQIADLIVESNEHQGVAKTVNRLILNNEEDF